MLYLAKQRQRCLQEIEKRLPKSKDLAGAWAYFNSNSAIYEAFSALFDWLKTRLTLLPNVGRIVMAAKAKNTSKRAYSTKSCPSSSRMNFFIKSIIVIPPK